MRLIQAVSHTHALTDGKGRARLADTKATRIDEHLGQFGLSLDHSYGEGRVDLSGLPMKVGDQILEEIRQLFGVHIAYNRHAYDGQKDR